MLHNKKERNNGMSFKYCVEHHLQEFKTSQNNMKKYQGSFFTPLL